MHAADPYAATRHAPRSTRRLLRTRIAPITLLAASVGLAACHPPSPIRPAAAVALASRAPVTSPSPAVRDFQAFALNALLVPLLDADVPSRWADPSMSVDCDAADVTIDGQHPDIGAPVPREPFTVRWHLQRCTPLDDYIELSGDIELRVEPTASGYAAQMRPHGLQVVSMYGTEAVEQPFEAQMSVAR
ncbi:MAG: hypothetical protein ABIO45_00875 [Burkholderiaceae bacterium]